MACQKCQKPEPLFNGSKLCHGCYVEKWRRYAREYYHRHKAQVQAHVPAPTLVQALTQAQAQADEQNQDRKKANEIDYESKYGLTKEQYEALKSKRVTRRKRVPSRDKTRELAYGLTKEQFEAMKSSQNGCCAGCARRLLEDVVVCVDYDQSTKTVRRLLCRSCHSKLKGNKKTCQ